MIHTRELVCELCRQFYGLGWVSGTGGGIAIREGDEIFMAPSGVQKERLQPGDLYVLDATQLDRCEVLQAPGTGELRVSECQPLFYNAFRLRQAGAVIHSHSLWPVLAARLEAPPGRGRVRLAGFEMLKGLRGKANSDVVEIPVVPNTPREQELSESMIHAMVEHPDVDALFVAGHGMYVWGRSWVEAKTQAECLDWLCQALVRSRQLGVDAGAGWGSMKTGGAP